MLETIPAGHAHVFLWIKPKRKMTLSAVADHSRMKFNDIKNPEPAARG
ncbi:MAG: hypothetical protein RLZZ599_36 [Bacteroidota bacterium]